MTVLHDPVMDSNSYEWWKSYVLSKILGTENFHNIVLVKKKKKKDIWCAQTSVDIIVVAV